MWIPFGLSAFFTRLKYSSVTRLSPGPTTRYSNSRPCTVLKLNKCVCVCVRYHWQLSTGRDQLLETVQNIFNTMESFNPYNPYIISHFTDIFILVDTPDNDNIYTSNNQCLHVHLHLSNCTCLTFPIITIRYGEDEKKRYNKL